MSCNCCPKAKPVPACVSNLSIGIAEPETDYLVIFKTPTGRVEVYPVTSDVDGKIILEDIDPGSFRLETVYEVWVSTPSAANIEERSTFTIGETDVTCLALQFSECYDNPAPAEDDEEPIDAFENQTITLQT